MQTTSCTRYMMGVLIGKAAAQKGPAGLSGSPSWMWDSTLPLWQGRTVVSWAALGWVLPGVEGGDPFTLVSTGEATAGVLWPVLGSSVKDRATGKSSERPWRWLMPPEHLFGDKRLSKLGLGKRRLRRWSQQYVRVLEDKPGLFLVVSSDRNRSSGHKLEQKRFSLRIRKSLFTVKGLDIDAGYPGGCEVSLLTDLQKPPGHELEQPVQDDAGWADRLNKVSSRGLFQSQPFSDLRVSHVLQTFVGRYLPHFS